MNHSIVLEQDTRQGVQLSKKQKKKLKRLQNVTSTGEQSASPVPQLPKQGDAARHPSKQSSGWNFAAEYNDHFETPVSAYADVSPVLQCIAEELGKSKEELVIYDPYYCKGSMVSHMAGLGYTNVINRNRDFYEDIATKAIPEFDVMVTNPPYSGEHKQKLLTFLMNRRVKKPFALLLPAYTVTKSYWRDFVTETEKRNKKRNGETVNNSSFIYILPSTSYNYDHPEGTGHKVPPFYSAWLIGGFSDITRFSPGIEIQKSGSSGAKRTRVGLDVGNTRGGVKPVVVDSIDAIISAGFVSAEKRPNPRGRKRRKG